MALDPKGDAVARRRFLVRWLAVLLLATGLAARSLGNLIRHPATRGLAALSIIAFALWQLWSLLPLVDAHGSHAPAPSQHSEHLH